MRGNIYNNLLHLDAGLPVLVAHGPAHDVVEDDCGGVSGEAGEEAGPGGAPADARHRALSLQAHDRLLEVTRVPDVDLRSELSTSPSGSFTVTGECPH